MKGRPSKFTHALAAEICERLSKGEPLASICRDDHMPAVRTVSDWKTANATFSADFARAREDGFDAIAADALDIADDDGRDWEPVYRDGVVVDVKVDGEHIQRSKLRIETRLKLLAKWDPSRYGEKVTQEHVGPQGGPIQTATIDPEKLTDDQLRAIASIPVAR